MKVLLYAALAICAAVALVLLLGPKEPVDREIAFDPATLPEDLDAWLAAGESTVPDLRPEAAKRIVWADRPGQVTPLSVVYLHGFSASAEEIRPVPDRVAEALGANLFFTRLAGHGRDGAAMAEPVAGDWVEDVAEAVAIGRRIGSRVLVVGASTGGTLAALAAVDPVLSEGVVGVVLVSPNFGVQNPAAGLLALPWARHWVHLVAGETRGFQPLNEAHALHWTTSYPSVATVPLIALTHHAAQQPYTESRVPALFIYSDADQVVDPVMTDMVRATWGAPTSRHVPVMGPGDDPQAHVVAGDILSPGQTETVTRVIVDWARSLPEI